MQGVAIINWGKFNCTLLADIFLAAGSECITIVCEILVAKLQLYTFSRMSKLFTHNCSIRSGP